MKKYLQNRSVALALCIAAVLGATVWNVNRSLRRELEPVMEAWSEKYGAEVQLTDRCDYAAQLWSLTRQYDALSAESDELRGAYNALRDSMDSMDYASMNENNAALSAAALRAGNAYLSLSGLSAGDRDHAVRCLSYMDSAARLLRESEYNNLAEENAALRGSLWLRFLRPVISVEQPLPIGDE